MFGFIEVTSTMKMSIAVCQIQSVFSVPGENSTKISCGGDTYTVEETYEEIMKKIRKEIMWSMRASGGGSI